MVELLKDTELTIGVKAGTSGKIFGSVNSIMVSNAIKEAKDIDIDRKKIHLDEDHIKEIGKYTATIKLYKDVKVDVTLDVVSEYTINVLNLKPFRICGRVSFFII